jgi:hypothetical protein
MVAILALLGVIALIPIADYDSSQAPTRDEVAVWESLPLTSDDVVLANGYTEGFIPDVTGADGLLDGRAPYTFGDLLRRANQLFRGAQAFFDDPAENWGFLAQHDVTWIVVGASDAHSLGTGNVWDTPRSLQPLESCGGLRRVVDDGGLTVFRVVDARPGGCA